LKYNVSPLVNEAIIGGRQDKWNAKDHLKRSSGLLSQSTTGHRAGRVRRVCLLLRARTWSTFC
jgi:hypothetical protein